MAFQELRHVKLPPIAESNLENFVQGLDLHEMKKLLHLQIDLPSSDIALTTLTLIRICQ